MYVPGARLVKWPVGVQLDTEKNCFALVIVRLCIRAPRHFHVLQLRRTLYALTFKAECEPVIITVPETPLEHKPVIIVSADMPPGSLEEPYLPSLFDKTAVQYNRVGSQTSTAWFWS